MIARVRVLKAKKKAMKIIGSQVGLCILVTVLTYYIRPLNASGLIGIKEHGFPFRWVIETMSLHPSMTLDLLGFINDTIFWFLVSVPLVYIILRVKPST